MSEESELEANEFGRQFGLARLAQIAAYLDTDPYRIGSRLPYEKKPQNKNRTKQKAQRRARKIQRARR